MAIVTACRILSPERSIPACLMAWIMASDLYAKDFPPWLAISSRASMGLLIGMIFFVILQEAGGVLLIDELLQCG